MVELAYIPGFMRNIRWGQAGGSEKDRHLREPLLNDSSAEENSDSEAERQPKHIVLSVEPKLTRSERLLRSGWSSFAFTRSHHMNVVPTVETTQDIVQNALAKLAGLTTIAVAMLMLALYRQNA